VEARDYKTSDEVTTPEQSALQLRLYALGLKSIGKPISKASIATLEEAEIKPVDVSEENIVKAQETAEIAIHHIKGGHFSPQPGKFCGACDYSRICSSCQETA
jgi:DNA helicase-2/ATP-dependent DNA helicase PcrA